MGGVGILKLNLECTVTPPSSMSCTMTGGVRPGDISPLMLPCCDVIGLSVVRWLLLLWRLGLVKLTWRSGSRMYRSSDDMSVT